MKIGEMRERVTVINPAETGNNYGEKTTVWTEDLIRTYAEVTYIRQGSSEEFEAAKKTSFTNMVFRVRTNTLITEKSRIVYRDKEHEIDSIAYTPDRCYMLIEAREDDKIMFVDE